MFKFIRDLKSNIDANAALNEAIIFSADTKEMFIDFNGVRSQISDIIYKDTLADLESIIAPIANKLYYVHEKSCLYIYANGEWQPVKAEAFDDVPRFSTEDVNFSEYYDNDKTAEVHFFDTDGNLLLPHTNTSNVYDEYGHTLSAILGQNQSVYDIMLEADKWQGTESPYSYTIELENVTEQDTIDLLTPDDITLDQMNGYKDANICSGDLGTNTLTIYAHGEKPSIDLPIIIIKRGHFVRTLQDLQVVDTLAAGETSLVLESEYIKEDSIIEIYTDVYGVSPNDVTLANGFATVTFDAQEKDIEVKLIIKYQDGNSDNHILRSIATETGIHGIRYIDGSLQLDDGNGGWVTISNDGQTNARLDELEAELDTVGAIARGRSQALAYSGYSEMITAVNEMELNDLSIGQNIYVGTAGVPDVWVYGTEATGVDYTYVDDNTFAEALKNGGTVQVGHYKLAQLETEEVDLSGILARIAELEANITPITSGTADLTAGTSELASGTIYCVYE